MSSKSENLAHDLAPKGGIVRRNQRRLLGFFMTIVGLRKVPLPLPYLVQFGSGSKDLASISAFFSDEHY